MNSDSTLCHGHLLGVIKALSQTLRGKISRRERKTDIRTQRQTDKDKDHHRQTHKQTEIKIGSDSTFCPSHLLGGIKALSQTLPGKIFRRERKRDRQT